MNKIGFLWQPSFVAMGFLLGSTIVGGFLAKRELRTFSFVEHMKSRRNTMITFLVSHLITSCFIKKYSSPTVEKDSFISVAQQNEQIK